MLQQASESVVDNKQATVSKPQVPQQAQDSSQGQSAQTSSVIQSSQTQQQPNADESHSEAEQSTSSSEPTSPTATEVKAFTNEKVAELFNQTFGQIGGNHAVYFKSLTNRQQQPVQGNALVQNNAPMR